MFNLLETTNRYGVYGARACLAVGSAKLFFVLCGFHSRARIFRTMTIFKARF